MSAHKKRVNLAVLERRKNVAARYVRGQTQWEIARAFEVDQGTISRDLQAIQEEWLASITTDRGRQVAAEIARVDEAERQAWLAWAKSQENAETLRARMHGDESTTEKISKGQAGDPRYLDIVLKCVARRCELLGLNAPVKVKEEQPFQFDETIDEDEFNKLPLDERIRILRQPGPLPIAYRAPGADSA